MTRPTLLALAPTLSNPDRAMSGLVEHGLAEKLGRGVWLIPTGTRPQFEGAPFWSNPGLQDPDRICALVVANPRLRNIVRVMMAYGPSKVESALNELVKQDAIPNSVATTAERMIASAKKGLVDAAPRLAP